MIGLMMLAAAMSGNTLHDFCSGEAAGKAICAAYIAGASDGMMVDAINRKIPLCLPNEVIVEQEADVVTSWLQRHPEKRQLPAIALVYTALREAFPCPAP